MRTLEYLVQLGERIDQHDTTMFAYWDRALICRFANQAYLTWFGLSPEEIIGKITLRELLGPLYQLNEPYISGALAGKVQVFERVIRKASGEQRLSHVTYLPDFEGSEVLGFYVYVADITALRTVKTDPLPELVGSKRMVLAVERELRENIMTSFPGINSLARRHLVSESKLKRDFKMHFGKGIKDHFRFLQMELAGEYMRDQGLSKKQLANLFGFVNPNNFSICYAKYLDEKRSVQEPRSADQMEHYYALCSQMGSATAMFDTELRFLLASDRWINDFNLGGQQWKGRRITEVFPHFNPTWLGAMEAAASVAVKAQEFYIRIKRTQLFIRWHVKPWFIHSAETGGVICSIELFNDLVVIPQRIPIDFYTQDEFNAFLTA